MRKFILAAAIVIGGCVMGACGSSTSTPAVTPVTSVSPSQAYLNELNGVGGDFSNVSDSTLLSLGNAACSDLEGGSSVTATAEDGINAVNAYPQFGLTYTDIGYVIGAAVKNICPQYTSEVDQFLQQQGDSTQ